MAKNKVGLEQETGVATSLEPQAEGALQSSDPSCSSGREAGAKPGRLRDAASPSSLGCPGSALPFRPRAAPWLGSPATMHPATLPSTLPPRGDLAVTAAAQILSPARGQTSSLRVLGPAVVSWFPHWSLYWSGWESFLCPLSSYQRSAVPAHPLQQSRGPEATRQGTRIGGWSIGALTRHPRPGERCDKGRWGRGEERGVESVLLRARKPPRLIVLAQLPPSRAHPAVPVGLGRAKEEAVRTLWPDVPAAPLPLSRVSGWTTVNVAMSALGAEVTLGFSISNRL